MADETVLKDILEELDRERSRRAELESKLREKELKTSEIALQTQVDSLEEIITVLTSRRKAIQYAQAHTPSLPLHVIRLLEIMPWQADQHIFSQENVYEWQIYRDKQWRSDLKFFPVSFKSLPVAKPGQEKIAHNVLEFLAGKGEATVVTNEAVTEIIKLQDGYPLPNDGGVYEWVGGWRVDKRIVAKKKGRPKLDCDEEGWAYANYHQDFVDPNKVWDSASKNGQIVNKYRRRKWTRQRVLVGYPHACDSTRHYLRIRADYARQSLTLEKMSDQLVETKTSLTETEARYLGNHTSLQHEVKQLQNRLKAQEVLLRAAGIDPEIAHETGQNRNVIEILKENEHLRELKGKIGDWIQLAQKKVSEETADWAKKGHDAIDKFNKHHDITPTGSANSSPSKISS